jgi:hypothetical protein
MSGTVHRVIVENGFDGAGSVVFDADFENEAADTLAFTEDSTNAATVSVVTTRYSYGLPNATLFSRGAVTYGSGADRYMFFTVTQPIEVDMYAMESNSGPASTANVYLGIYATDGNFQPTGAPIGATSFSVPTSATGMFQTQITPVTLTPGNYAVAYNSSQQIQWRAFTGGVTFVPGSFANYFYEYRRSRGASAMPTNPGPWNTTNIASTSTYNVTLLRWRPL